MKMNLYKTLEKICEQVKCGKMVIEEISVEPHIQPRYLTDTLKETIHKDLLEYYEYNIKIIQHNDSEN